MEPIIELKNIDFAYDDQLVLKNINLVINCGDDIAIVGHNGCGKSTLCKILAGLIQPSVGTFLFKGENVILSKNNILRCKIGLIFQNVNNQLTGSTVAEDIAFGLENNQVHHDQMDHIINDCAVKVGIVSLLDKDPYYLSGGQKQKLAIADILVMLPDVIIFDESLSMLDTCSKKEILELIAHIKQQNKQIVIIRITHDLDEACLSNRILVLSHGSIVFDGAPSNLFQQKEMENLHKWQLDIPFIIKLNVFLKRMNLITKENYNFYSLMENLCK